MFGEAVRGLTGLRRDPGADARAAQIAGRAVTSIGPRWLMGSTDSGLWRLDLIAADALIRFRSASERRRACVARFESRSSCHPDWATSVDRAVAWLFGIRNFWESHPAQLDIRNARTEQAEVTMWLWAPEAPPMDLRFYHDGMGQDTHEKQPQGLNITYEDYEPVLGTPVGVARTSEMRLWLLDATPPRERFVQLAGAVRTPAAMVAVPQTLHQAGVFGRTFSLPDRSVAKQSASKSS